MCVNLISQALILDKMSEYFCPETRIVALSSTCLRAAYNNGQLSGGMSLIILFAPSHLENLLQKYVGPYHAYAMSKLALSIYISKLAEKKLLISKLKIIIPFRNLKVATLHPGVVPGRLYRNVNFFLKFITYVVLPCIMRLVRSFL